MKKPKLRFKTQFVIFYTILFLLSGAYAAPVNQEKLSPKNPFLRKSTLPYQLPPFAQIKESDFAPAFVEGMRIQQLEIEDIVNNKESPTFKNTVIPYEQSGAILSRVSKVFFNLTISNTNKDLTDLEEKFVPKLSSHSDSIMMNRRLFERVQNLYKNKDSLGLDPESLQLLNRTYISFVRSGAELTPEKQDKLRELNEKLAQKTTQFRLNVMKANEESAVIISDINELDGLKPETIAQLSASADSKGIKGKYLISLQNTTVQPIIGLLKNRAVREKIFKASVERAGSRNDSLISEIMQCRTEKAQLLGYATPADYVLEDNAAKTATAVNQILKDLSIQALRAADREALDIQNAIDTESKLKGVSSFKLESWDWDYYANQVSKSKFGFNEESVRPYFELNHVLKDGVFFAAHELFGISFKERRDLKAYRKDVRIYEVQEEDGKPLGLFITDFYARSNKQGGAWMNSIVDQSDLSHSLPVVIINLNIAAPTKSKEGGLNPVFLSFDEVTTLFHEFGHALHGLFTKVNYASLSGTNVPPDFGEYPSQFFEMWAREPKVLEHFAKHYKTGMLIPKDLFKKIISAQTFNRGFETTSYLAAATLDQYWHQIKASEVPSASSVRNFEDSALRQSGFGNTVVPVRYHSPYFLHIFTIGYESGYYAYLWSEVLARDSGEWFYAHGGMNRENGNIFREKILSRGRTQEPDVLFKAFYGQAPKVAPLLEYKGLSDLK